MRIGESKKIARLIKFCFLILIFCNCLILAACQTKEERAASAVKKCQIYLDKDNVEEAGNCYQQAMLANPDAATEISKTGENAVFKKCLEFKDKKDFSNAIICLEGVVALRPDSANINFQLADSYFQYYLQRIRIDEYTDKDFLNKANTYIKKSIEINSDNAIVHETYGEMLKEKGDLKQALLEYQKATQLEPKDNLYWIKLALILEKIDNNDEAINTYKQALIVDPNDTDALYFLGVLYEKMGKFDEAIEMIERQNKIETPNEETLQRLKELKKRVESEKQNKQPKKKAKAA